MKRKQGNRKNIGKKGKGQNKLRVDSGQFKENKKKGNRKNIGDRKRKTKLKIDS